MGYKDYVRVRDEMRALEAQREANRDERDTGPFGLTAAELLELAGETAEAEAANGFGADDRWADALAAVNAVDWTTTSAGDEPAELGDLFPSVYGNCPTCFAPYGAAERIAYGRATGYGCCDDCPDAFDDARPVDGEWRVYVKPDVPAAYEVPGDPDSALVGPYGDTFFEDRDEAVAFAALFGGTVEKVTR